jgi:multiple sugar transport system substrate-binding protein
MQKGQLLAVEDYFGKELLDDFYPAKLRAHQYEGHLYGLPKYVSTIVMAYNKDILDKAGVEYPDGTWDWYKYLEAYRATTKPDEKQWGTYVSEWYWEHYVWMNGGEVMTPDLFGTKCLLDEPKAIEALKYLYDMIYGSKPVSPQSGSVPEHDVHNVFSIGKIAFVETHSWTVTNYLRECNFQWDFVDLPVSPSGGKATICFADGYAIAAKTKQPEAAIKLLGFLVSPWAEKAMCISIVGLQPTRRSVAPVWDTQSVGAQAGKNVAAFSKIMEYARLDPAYQDDAQIQELTNPIWDQIWVTNEIGLEEGINEIVKRVDDYFASKA